MVDRLGVPPELDHLIEKRSGEQRRQTEPGLCDGTESPAGAEPIAELESADDVKPLGDDESPAEDRQSDLLDRRSGDERRQTGDGSSPSDSS